MILNPANQSEQAFEQTVQSRSMNGSRLWKPILISWNQLSLDAPVVAVTWQRFVIANSAQHDEASIGWTPSVVLFLTVWLIYAGDRLLDVRQLDFRCRVAERHRFTKRWEHLLWPLWWALFGMDALISVAYLELSVWIAGFVLGCAVVVYAWGVHGPQWRAIPKEFIVGFLFSVGVCLPLLCRPFNGDILLVTLLLAALFSLNCLCVAAVQQSVDRAQRVDSAIGMFPSLKFWLSCAGLVLAGCTIVLAVVGMISGLIAAAIAVSALGLSQIGRRITESVKHDRTTPLAGYMADVVLLSPIVFVLAQT